jgi:hypothetical protein
MESMQRRSFLQLSTLAAAGPGLADTPMPMATLGKTGLRVSKFCLGGAHMAYKGEDNGIRIVRRAIELGVTFLDSAHLYN